MIDRQIDLQNMPLFPFQPWKQQCPILPGLAFASFQSQRLWWWNNKPSSILLRIHRWNLRFVEQHSRCWYFDSTAQNTKSIWREWSYSMLLEHPALLENFFWAKQHSQQISRILENKYYIRSSELRTPLPLCWCIAALYFSGLEMINREIKI